MPLYEYECRKCSAHTEVIQKMTDKPLTKCRKCGGRLEKLLSAPAIQFKGAGWYVTDYAGKKGADAKEEKTAGASTEVKASDKATPKEQASSKKASAPKNTPPSSGD
jgi:putative FmdB family regulatory protein